MNTVRAGVAGLRTARRRAIFKDNFGIKQLRRFLTKIAGTLRRKSDTNLKVKVKYFGD